MNKEEKEAIKSLKEFIYENGWMQVGKGKTILNLIDKQQKELDNAMLKIKQILKLKENVEITKGLEMIQELLEEK